MSRLLSMTNPFCLRFIPVREKLSAGLFYCCAWAYILCITYINTTLKSTDAVLNRQFTSFAFTLVYISMLNLLFLCDYKLRDMLFIAAVIGVFYIAWKHGASANAMSSCALAFSGKHVKPRSFWVMTTAVFILIVLSVVWNNHRGYLVSRNYYRKTHLRIDFGFEHPNGLGSFILTACCYWLILRYPRLAWYDYLIFPAASAFCWFGPSSRAASMVLLMLSLALPFIKRNEAWLPDSRLYRFTAYAIYPACCLVSLFGALAFRAGNPFWEFIDAKLFTGRIYHANIFLKNYSMPLWGQRVKIIGTQKAALTGQLEAILDNNYVRLILEYGLIPCLALGILLIAITYIMLRQRRCDMLLVLFLFAIYIIYENRITRIVIFCPLFVLPQVIDYFDTHVFPGTPDR